MSKKIGAEGSFLIGEWRVHPSLDRIEKAGSFIDIDPCPMAVLVQLASKAGHVVSADELIADVWGGRFVSDNPVYKSIALLRKAFNDDARDPRFIETIPKHGYRLIAPTSFEQSVSAEDHLPERSATRVPDTSACAPDAEPTPAGSGIRGIGRRLWPELLRRRVLSTLAVYITMVVFLAAATAVMLPALPLPVWLLRLLIALAIAGLPLVSMLAWIFDINRTDTNSDRDPNSS